MGALGIFNDLLPPDLQWAILTKKAPINTLPFSAIMVILPVDLATHIF
jgi:hypothetical protein